MARTCRETRGDTVALDLADCGRLVLRFEGVAAALCLAAFSSAAFCWARFLAACATAARCLAALALAVLSALFKTTDALGGATFPLVVTSPAACRQAPTLKAHEGELMASGAGRGCR
jgi:hypothetical protein